MTEHAAVIAGGGPTGLMLAGEVPRRVRRRSQPDLQESGYRLPRVGPVN
jgi:NADH dehydrogenase FAD-containing subunit